MSKKIRILQLIINIINPVYFKFISIKKNLSLNLLFIFIGFLVGNLFGNFLIKIRQFLNLDILIILVILFLMEILNSTIYLKKNKNFLFFLKKATDFKEIKLFINLNYFKIGILLGFFIDAFKVGS
uniref:Hypothetical chloroplast RF20 n=1 Tax=Interfilum terricola TaxID=163310 RepID=A0A097KPP0_9VIRI|nr:hypothetical chloroplast RF20 [Interfilum terricola]AIT95142.1 hypothetical chloroplast RF20 [Interfilum terricola]